MAGSRSCRNVGRASQSTYTCSDSNKVPSRNVALKFLEADALATSKEAEMLQCFRVLDAGEHRVIELLDAFDHPSANGVHRVLVMEPVLKFDLRRTSDYIPTFGRDAIRQMMAGVAFIHGRGLLSVRWYVPFLLMKVTQSQISASWQTSTPGTSAWRLPS